MKSIFEWSPEEARERPGLDLAVVHLTFEGIRIYGGGVSSVIRGHLEALSILRPYLQRRGITVTPYVAEIAYNAEHPRRDPEYERYAVEKVRSLDGDVAYLTNTTWGQQPFTAWGEHDLGPVSMWKAACASGAAVALNFARRHRAAVVYCHDAMFALASLYAALQSEAYGVDLRALYVVHSTGLTHELPMPNPERLMAESASMHWAKITPKVKIGTISEFIREHLVRDYGVHMEHCVPAGNGIHPVDRHFRLRSDDEKAAKLKEHGIPLDRPLLVSWGRAVPYKRFDMVVQAAARLKGRIWPVVVVTPHSEELLRLKDELRLAGSLIFAFDPELIACILQWPGTEVAAFLAYLEPCGLTPMEVRMHARRTGPLLVTSDTGGLVEQVHDGVDGFITRQDDPDDVAAVVARILAMSTDERDRIRKAGHEAVLGRYTWPGQILATLSALSAHVNLVGDDVKGEMIERNWAT